MHWTISAAWNGNENRKPQGWPCFFVKLTLRRLSSSNSECNLQFVMNNMRIKNEYVCSWRGHSKNKPLVKRTVSPEEIMKKTSPDAREIKTDMEIEKKIYKNNKITHLATPSQPTRVSLLWYAFVLTFHHPFLPLTFRMAP